MASETVGRVSLGDGALYQAALEGMSSAVAVLTLDGQIEYLNPAAETLLGVVLNRVQGQPLRTVLGSSDEMDRLAEFRPHVLSTGRWDGDVRLQIRDGRSFTARCKATLLRDAEGEPSSILVVADELRADNRTEAALLGALEQFRALAECMPSLVHFRWNDGRPGWYNPRFMEFTGLSYRELEREGWRSVLHPDDRALVPAVGWSEPWESEVRLRRHDGQYRRMMMRTARVTDARGEAIGFVGIALDVHDTVEARAQAEEAHRTLNAIWERNPVSLGLLGPDLRWIRVNEQMATTSGVPAEEWVGKTPPEVLPRLVDYFKTFSAELARTGKPIIRRPRTFEMEGAAYHRLDSWIPLYDDEGNLLKVAVVVEDVTPVKRAQTAAEHALLELDGIYQSAPIGLAVLDREMRFLRVNDRLARMNGVPTEEHLGRRPVDIVPEAAAQATEAVEQVLDRGEPVIGLHLTSNLAADPAAQRHYLENWIPLKDDAGSVVGMSIAVEDVTELTRAQEVAEEAMRELDAIYRNAPIGLAVMDREMRFLRVNQRLAEMTGIPMVDHIGKLPSEVISVEADGGLEAVKAVLVRGEPVIGLRVRVPDTATSDHRHWLENWMPLKSESGAVTGICISVEDVTEREHAVDAVSKSRERLQQTLDILPEAVAISNSRGEINFADQQWVARTGLQAGSSSRADLIGLVHEDDRERVEERWRIARASGRPFTATYRVRHPDGAYRWQVSRAVPMTGAAGRVREWIETLADVDDVKQTEQLLATALAELDITYRTAPVGLGVLDLDLRYLRLNERLAAVSGQSVEDLIGQSVADVVPDIADAARAVRDQIVATGEAVLGIETEGIAPGAGDYRYCLENWIPIKNPEGNVVAISVSVEDVTSLKRATEDLSVRAGELDAVFQTASVGLALLDKDLRFIRVNERMAELNALDGTDLLGRELSEIIRTETGTPVASARRALAGERITGDLYERNINGERRWRQAGWVPVTDEGGEILGVGLAVEDVTPLKRAEHRLQAALSELSTTYQFAPVGLAVLDPEGRFVRVNELLSSMHGLPVWEHIGRSSSDVLAAGDDWAREIVARTVATGEPVLGIEVVARLPVGSDVTKHLRVSCAPMRNQRDEVFAIAAAVEDISDIKAHESLLTRSEERLRAILDAVPATIGVTDAQGHLVSLNQHWLDYSGMQNEPAHTRDLSATFHPDETAEVTRAWARAIENEEPCEVVQRLRRADGEYRWHLGRAVPMRDASGAVTGWVSTNIDIDDRKRIEEQLEAALAEIEATYQGAPIGLAVVDLGMRYVRVNEALAAANGMPAWRHTGKRLGDLAHCSAEDVERLARSVLESGTPQLNVELTSQPRRGRPRTWRFNMVPLRDARRDTIGVSIAAEDVTVRKLANDEVRSAKDQLGRILDSIPAPVIVLDEDGMLRLGNRQFWDYTGLRLDRSQVHPMAPLAESVLHPDERDGVLAGYRGAIEREEGYVTVCRLRRYDGEYRWHMGAVMALPPGEDGKRAWVGTYMDFEDRKRAEDALQAANRVKDEFLGMVSHELRTPLTTILGLADMLHRRMEEMDREVRLEALEQLEDDARRLNELIENMLLLSRAEQAVFDPEPVLLQRVAPMVLAVAAERHREARWEMDLPEDLPPVAGKAGWLEQVFQNLVSNAVKYSQSPAQIRIEARRAGPEIELRVMDRGRGIRADEADRMFEPFFRAARASYGQPGLGLGLSVCKRLVELMGGQISAASRPGGGTIVTVRLGVATSRSE